MSVTIFSVSFNITKSSTKSYDRF